MPVTRSTSTLSNRKSRQCFCGCELGDTRHSKEISKKKPVKEKSKSKPSNDARLKGKKVGLSTKKKGETSSAPGLSPLQKKKQQQLVVKLQRFDENLLQNESSKNNSLNSFKAPAPKLRERKPINYIEISLESRKSEEQKRKLPIYKQFLPEENKKKKNRDLYEFDSDSEKNKKRRKHNDSSQEYEIPVKRVRKRKKKQTLQAPQTEITVPKINIISNIQLEPDLEFSVASPSRFAEEPVANSTMIAPKPLTPWRFNAINITRNPHFISLKDSCLPRMDQDPVLDHTFVEKLDHPIINNKESKKKSIKQTKLSDFIECKDANKENTMEVSLFDVNQLSPIRSRRILGEKQMNQQSENIITEKNTPEASSLDNTDFGFGSSNESIKSNSNKPFRLSISLNDKKYVRNVKRYKRKDSHIEEKEDSDEETEGQINLFDDFADTQDLIEELDAHTDFVPKVNKRKKHKKKHSDVRTKKEEEEAEKWAQDFNKMCEEIDQFPLTIE